MKKNFLNIFTDEKFNEFVGHRWKKKKKTGLGISREVVETFCIIYKVLCPYNSVLIFFLTELIFIFKPFHFQVWFRVGGALVC